MPDQPVTQPAVQPVNPPVQQAEHMVPLTRLNEVIERARKAEERLAQIEAEAKANTEKTLAEQNKYKELYDGRAADLAKAQAEAAKVTHYEATLTAVLAAQIEGIPEDKRQLVPTELPISQQLAWISRNAAILKAPAAFDIGAGRQGGGQSKSVNLTAEEHAVAVAFGMSDAEYAKNK